VDRARPERESRVRRKGKSPLTGGRAENKSRAGEKDIGMVGTKGGAKGLIWELRRGGICCPPEKGGTANWGVRGHRFRESGGSIGGKSIMSVGAEHEVRDRVQVQKGQKTQKQPAIKKTSSYRRGQGGGGGKTKV